MPTSLEGYFTGSEIAFSFGPLVVRWYGLIITSAVLVGYIVAYRRVVSRGEEPDHLTNILVYGLIAAIIGARAYYVLFSLSDYIDRPAEIFAIWHGGIAIHGALIGALGATYIYARRHRLNFLKWADLLIPSMILGQAIGRWGNYMNQEAFGGPTNLPWAIFIDPIKRPAALAEFEYFHPTFLYESIWNLAGFALLIYLSRRQIRAPRLWPAGSIFIVYCIYYSVGRGLIEGLRTDSLMLGPIRIAQLVSLVAVIGGAALLVKWRRAAQEAGGRKPQRTSAPGRIAGKRLKR